MKGIQYTARKMIKQIPSQLHVDIDVEVFAVLVK